jgi:hypothetical protein
MIAIFEAEIQEHQSLAEHYRQLAAAREEMAAKLAAIEGQATATLQSLVELKEKIRIPSAIAKLKSAVLTLFPDSDGDGGNKPTDPIPDPAPTNLAGSDGDDEFDILALNGETGECLTTDDPQEEEESQQKDFGEEGLIYHLENKAVMYVCFPSGKLSVWIGFEKKAIARSWQKFLDPMAEKIELIPGDAYKWQLFIKGLSIAQITKLAQCDFTECHRTEVCTATPPAPLYRFQPPAIQIGTKVTKLNSSEIFEATSLVANKIFFAKSTITGERKLFSSEDVKILHDPLPEGTPQYATVLLAECPWKGEKLQIVAEGEGGYTLATPKGNYWYRRDCVELFDEQIEQIADATEPVHPVTQRSNRVQPAFGSAPGGLSEESEKSAEAIAAPTEPTEPAPDTHSILCVGDIVQILSDRYPQFHEHVGTVAEITTGMPPILIKAPRGIKPYHRADLKLISKALPVPAEEKKELVAAGEFDSADDF